MTQYKLVPREAFEAAITEDRLAAGFDEPVLDMEEHEGVMCYRQNHIQAAWWGWKARSAAPDVQGEPVQFDYPDFHDQGMGCGLEDRGITGRYEAMRYGWDQAIEQFDAILGSLGHLYTAPQTVEQPSDYLLDAITGALASGKQGVCPPPSGHWLQPYWEMGNTEREQQLASDVAGLVEALEHVRYWIDRRCSVQGVVTAEPLAIIDAALAAHRNQEVSNA